MPINNIGVNLLLLYMRRFPLEAGKWRFSQWLNERTHKIETVARTSYGFLMHLNTRDFIQHTIFVTGRWDDDVGRVILSRLKTDDVFVDIGANVGYFSLLASQICSKVISFEPNPTCLAQLNRNIEINKRQNIDVRPVGLADKRDSYPSELSGGQQQRIAIARALAMKPKLMLFDEPTSALDPELVGEVLKAMSALARSGMTMVIVTHELGFAFEIANRVVFLDEGTVAADGSPHDVLLKPEHPRLKSFVNRFHETADMLRPFLEKR